MQGQIIKIISNQYTVLVNNEKLICQARGVFRNRNITPLVGDFCLVNMNDLVIDEILKRKNTLNRPSVSNIDVALIITSIKEPNLSLNLLDKLITSVIYHNIEPVICFTKLDLADNEDKILIETLSKYYKSIGIEVLYSDNLDELKKTLKHKTIALTGQSGSGKSSLLNKIDKTLNLKTDKISTHLGRGKHTTRHVELFFTNDMLIMDTPGFSNLDDNISLEDLKSCFFEFKKYPCLYTSCNHHKEKECNVIKAVNDGNILKSRYDNYLKIGGLK